MSQIIIAANPTETKLIPNHNQYLEVAEFFCNTIQGEGINTGHPAAFLRMQHCTQNCFWCDTTEVWRYGNPYTFEELFRLMDEAGLPEKLHKGQHLVLTGGSPLKQQERLVEFLYQFTKLYDFIPYIEIENECTLEPNDQMINYVDCWNNSPKLANSGNIRILRYQPDILKKLSYLDNSWFKFVVTGMEDWEEIEKDFLQENLIHPEQIILMPEGATRERLEKNREAVIDIAIKNNVRYCAREHVVVWDKATGV